MAPARGFSRALLFLPVLFWMGVIYLLSCRGDLPGLHSIVPHLDKLAHAVAYGILGFLAAFFFRAGLGWSWGRAALGAVVLASLYGVTDEWHQSFVPGRSVEIADWIADTVGAALAQIVTRRLWAPGPGPAK